MTETANVQLTGVHDIFVVHRAFRREFILIPPLVRAVPAGDTARAAVLTDHARRILEGLHLHHSGEDELLWPKLLERWPPDAALIARMEGQHEQVAARIERLGPALDRWEAEARPAVTEEVAATFDELRAALFTHLEEEETEILPLAARHVSQAEWDKLGEHGFGHMKKSDLPRMAWMVLEEATPEEPTCSATVPFCLPTMMRRRPGVPIEVDRESDSTGEATDRPVQSQKGRHFVVLFSSPSSSSTDCGCRPGSSRRARARRTLRRQRLRGARELGRDPGHRRRASSRRRVRPPRAAPSTASVSRTLAVVASASGPCMETSRSGPTRRI